MPLYDYKCHQCNKTFEVRQKMTDEPLRIHEECGGEAERLISLPSLQFKGTGWYVTDYGKGGKLPAGSNGPNGKSESSESKAESSKTETSKSESAKTESPKTESSKSESSKSETKTESKPASS